MSESENTPSVTPHDRTGATHVVLVPGYWLGAWAWDDVVPGLRSAGLVPHPVTLPGLQDAKNRTVLAKPPAPDGLKPARRQLVACFLQRA